MTGCRCSLKWESASSQASREVGSLRVSVGTVEDGNWVGGVGTGFVVRPACGLGLTCSYGRGKARSVPGLSDSRISGVECREDTDLQEALFFR